MFETVPGRVWPVIGVAGEAVLDRVAVQIGDMGGEVGHVADEIVPIEALPGVGQGALAAGDALGEAAGKAGAERLHPRQVVGVARRQHRDQVHMAGQEHSGNGLKRVEAFDVGGAVTEQADVFGEQVAVRLTQAEREEIGAAGAKAVAVTRHGVRMPRLAGGIKFQMCDVGWGLDKAACGVSYLGVLAEEARDGAEGDEL